MARTLPRLVSSSTARWVALAGVVGWPWRRSRHVGVSHCEASAKTVAESSWTRNLLFIAPSGFWADDYWYDLQMERRLPLTRDLLREFIFALPPLGASHRVCDLGCGTGRSAAALQAAYPMARLTLVDPDEGRLSLARRKLSEAEASDGSSCVSCIAAAVHADGQPLPGSLPEGYDCILALQAVRHIVAPPPHYAAKLQLETVAGEAICAGYARMFAGLYASVKPGGHVFIGDHVVHQHPGVFQHCKLLEAAGFTDIDVAWRQNDWFVIGARRPVT
ncbi:unnamed protein product [Durusdinium trenchii]|uniref:Methyltransferase domain-containing protein n=1 Tax=Durusdinium trenchii TaxID=1381693 RepID=A0ABP0QF55_9DINO